MTVKSDDHYPTCEDDDRGGDAEVNETGDALPPVSGEYAHRDDVPEPCLIHRIDRGQYLMGIDWETHPVLLPPSALPDTTEPYADVVADAICAAEHAGVSESDVLHRAKEIVHEVKAEADQITSAGSAPAEPGKPARRLRIVKKITEES